MSVEISKDLNWYAKEMPENDIVLSTRARLARNLSNFPFPPKFFKNDVERVQKIFEEAFKKIEKSKEYNFLHLGTIDPISLGILAEQGYIKKPFVKSEQLVLSSSAVFINSTGNIGAEINGHNHIHISSFSAGLNISEVYKNCSSFEQSLQKVVNFAFLKDFGYLDTQLLNSGTGLKITARFHIPAIYYSKKFAELDKILKDYRLKIFPMSGRLISPEKSGEKYFTVSTFNSLQGSEIDQIANFESACRHIINLERKSFESLAQNRPTINRHNVIQAYSLAKFSIFMSFPQALNLISDIYFGLRLKILSGMQFSDLNRLIYHIQNAHLEFLLKNEKFDFEKDIVSDHSLVLDRIRAIVFQEAIQKLVL